MLILSKRKDYYDVGMKLGIDKTCVYERNTINVKGTFPSTSYLVSGDWASAVLAFCGEFYPFVYRVPVLSTIDEIIWDVEEAVQTLPMEKRRRSYWYDDISTEADIRKFFDQQYPKLESIYHEYRTPIFGFHPVSERPWRSKKEPYESLVINPNLKDIEFYKVKDPITAYQEVYMFMSGVIGAPPKPKEKVDDKIMAASKGHDGPYSFKKPPGKRGRNKWR